MHVLARWSHFPNLELELCIFLKDTASRFVIDRKICGELFRNDLWWWNSVFSLLDSEIVVFLLELVGRLSLVVGECYFSICMCFLWINKLYACLQPFNLLNISYIHINLVFCKCRIESWQFVLHADKLAACKYSVSVISRPRFCEHWDWTKNLKSPVLGIHFHFLL